MINLLKILKLTKTSFVGPRPTKLKKKGFTLIELLLTVAILLVIGGMAIPFYSRFLTQNSVENTRDKIIQVVRKAQMYAMLSRKSNTSGWGVYYSSNVMTLYQGASYASRVVTWDETYTFDTGVTVSGLTEINFARVTGVPIPTSASITISGTQGSSKNLTMNSMGMITRN